MDGRTISLPCGNRVGKREFAGHHCQRLYPGEPRVVPGLETSPTAKDMMNKRQRRNKVRCLKGCAGQLTPVFITETYTQRGSRMVVTVTGIPALECAICHERLTDLKTYGEVERFVSPLLELGRRQGRLPMPRVTIEFPQVSQSERRSA